MKDKELREYLLGSDAKLRKLKLSFQEKIWLSYPCFWSKASTKENIFGDIEETLKQQHEKMEKIEAIIENLLEYLKLEVCKHSSNGGTIQKKGHEHIIK